VNGPQLFNALNDALPLVLLPVRLVTRFHRPDPQSPPSHLHVRIHPDVIGADGHDPTLTEHEEQLGHEYRARVAAAGGDDAQIAEARSWLASQLDPYRALWVSSAVAKKAARREAPRPTIARLLPARWLAIGVVNNEEVDRWWSLPVTADLPMAPNLAALDAGDGVRPFLRKQGLHWMVDFDEAVRVGMGIEIPLDNVTALNGFDELLVVGVGDRPDDSAALAALLAAHRYTEGLDFVPQGSPTNNTDTVASAVTTDAPELGPLFESETADVLPRGRPALTEPALLYRMTAANAASIALGVSQVNALDRAEKAGLTESRRMHAMQRALWGSTLAYLLSGPLAYDGHPLVEGAGLEWLRDWFVDYVRGGAALPTLRIGTQPYGLLPVTKMPSALEIGSPSTNREWLEYTVSEFLETWISSVDHAPTLSPVPGGTPPGAVASDEAVTVASVLGAVPHPIRLRLRDALDSYDELRDEWEGLLAAFETSIGSEVPQNDRTRAWLFYNPREAAIRGSGGLSSQLANLSLLRGEYRTDGGGDGAGNPYKVLMDQITDVLIPALERHDDRAKLRTTVGGAIDSAAALADSDDPRLWYVLYETPEGDEQAPTLEVVDRDPKELAAMLRRLADPEPGPVITIPPSVRISLLNRLIRRSYESPPADFVADLKDAVLDIADVADWDTGDPVGELERLTAETLGLLTHRLDAWHASLAAERLAQKRFKGPGGVPATGVQVGGYGWVVNLAPDDGEADTQGFIHAPSLAHAATAAVLRSAWSAFSTDARAAAFAVDLSSDRIRRADWILGGVRGGQTLEQLLGGRFERRLHDALLDTYIDVIREAVLRAQGSTAPASEIVDGLALAEAYAELPPPAAPGAVRTEVDAVIAGADEKQLTNLLHQASVDLDSVSDALTAQAVHSVLAGDLAEAAAATAAMGSGDSGVPELRFSHVHRESDLVMHRVAALLGDEQPAVASLLGTIEPALCAWAERLVAGFEKLPCRVGSATFPLSAVGLTAYQLLALAGSARLERLVAGWARRFKGAAAGAAAELPAELSALVPLRQAIGRARPLGRHDLTREETDPAPNVGELEKRRDAVATAATTLSALEATDQLLQTRLADLVTVDDAGTIAALETDDPHARQSAMQAVIERAARTVLELGAKYPDGWESFTAIAKAAHLAERIAAASRIPITVLPRCTAADAAGLAQAFKDGAQRGGTAPAIAAWLLQVGRVHGAAGLLEEGLGLVDLASGAARSAYSLAQLPNEAGEPWAAVARPRGGRTCIVSVTDPQRPLAATELSGLLFDSWSEPVPRRDVMTGVAVHFDSPSSRPPQAVLLMTVPPDPGFNVNEIVAILRDTLNVTRCRAIGTETLESLGQYLPGLFLPEGYKVRERA
jgi:hypothetical protein